LKRRSIVGGLIVLALATSSAPADVMQFGDRNLLNTGAYPDDPTAGATLQGLAPGAVTAATRSYAHPFPFTPDPGTFAGTDQMYASGQDTRPRDGYSGSTGSVEGPQVLTMDYSSLVPSGQEVESLTLGIAADDFQQPRFGLPYVARVNQVIDAALTDQLNAMDLGGPEVRFFSVGIDPAILAPSNVLELSIARTGQGSDGWAVDFTTIGVTTAAQSVPEPTTLSVLVLGAVALGLRTYRRRRNGIGVRSARELPPG
jgi:hypothetical protein